MLKRPAVELLRKFNVYHKSDTAFQANARLLQSIWREEKGYQSGRLGNYLSDSDADLKRNYPTEKIGELVEAELQNKEKMIGQPRIWNNLLSSQPLAFNLFGELKLEAGYGIANGVFSELFPDRMGQVTGIEFEYSPSRRNPKYTNDRSAFDVFVEYCSAEGEKCFWGIEVKYSEDMKDGPARVREEYGQVAKTMGIFKPEALDKLASTSLQQLWRDQLLAGSMFKKNRDYDRGDFIVLYPEENTACQKAIDDYQECLKPGDGYFIPLTLEKFYQALNSVSNAAWVAEFYDRYLDFGKLKNA